MHEGETVPTGVTGSADEFPLPPPSAVPPGPPSAAIMPPPPKAQPILPMLAAQRRSRRLRFLAGLAIIVVPGALWAGLTTDPIRQQNFDGFVDEAVFVGGPPIRAIPELEVISEAVDLASGEELTLDRRLDANNLMILTLDEGDRIEVRLASVGEDFPPGYRSIIDLNLTNADGSSSSSASVVFPPDDTVALDYIVDSAGEHTLELIGDFSPFHVDVTIARNVDAASADDSTEEDGG